MAETIRNGQTMDDMKSSAECLTSKLVDGGREAFSQAASSAKEALSNMEGSVDRTLSGVGSRVNSAADSIRSNSPKFVNAAAEKVAGALESGGDYLQQHGVSDMAGDAKSLVKRYPIESMIIGFGAGLFLGRTFLKK